MKEVLAVEGLRKSYTGNDDFAVKSVNLKLVEGEVCSVVGQSGCGKSTFLRLLAGLETPSAGKIVLNNEVVASSETFVEPEKRKVGLVFQYFALFPHMTVSQNIAFGISGKNKESRVNELLSLIGLEGYGQKYPHQLSGGEQQRIALARALAPKPSIILLDEPFSNLDASLKQQLRDDLFDIIKSTGVTCLFVTHDINDAVAVADKVAVVREGQFVQVAEPRELYEKPKDAYVANLFEEINELSSEDLKLFDHQVSAGSKYGVRLKDLKILDAEGEVSTKAKLISKKYLGRETVVVLELESGKQVKIVLLSRDEVSLQDSVIVGFDKKDLIEFQ